MDEFIKILLLLSLSGTLFLLIIWILKYFYKKVFSKRWQYYILLLAALRFLLPVFTNYNIVGYFYKITGDVAIQNNIAVMNTSLEDTGSIKGSGSIEKDTENASRNKNKRAKDIASKVTILNYILGGLSFLYNNLFYIWLVSFIIFITRNIVIYKRFMDYIKATSEKVQDKTDRKIVV